MAGYAAVNSKNLVRALKKFSKLRLMVVGDIMLDHYIWGHVERISPEAPVPVVSVARESMHLGGAANVAHNIISLGGKVDLCGVIGKDDFGGRILQEMKDMKLKTDGLCIDRTRPTTKKTRVIAHNQQVVRFDRELREAVSDKLQDGMIAFVRRRISQVNGIVVSDYSKGVLTQEVMSELIGLAHQYRIPIMVDPKVNHMAFYKGVHIITPNHGEAIGAAGTGDASEDGLSRTGSILLDRLGCEAVLITRGEHGMSLFERDGEVTHIPTVAQEIYDVTGAGDAVIGTMAMAICAGCNLKEAAVMANYAAGIVVGIVGTATVQRSTLERFIKVGVEA